MTLVELVMAIVIISTGLAGLLLAFSTVASRSADPVVRKQMLALAEEMMEEVLLQPFSQPAGLAGSIVGCNRSQADDVMDYAGYSCPPGEVNGDPIAGYAAYNVSVRLDNSAGLTLGGLVNPATAGDRMLIRVEVTVSAGAESLRLVGWRTRYAI